MSKTMGYSNLDKVALFLPSLHAGGAEHAMVNLANGFVNKGIQVDLVLAKAQGRYLEDVDEKVQLFDLKAQRVLTSFPGLIRYLIREKPVALLSTLGHACIIALWAKILARSPVRILFRAATTPSLDLKETPRIKRYALLQLTRWFYPWADGIVATSNGVADDLISYIRVSPKLVRVIYSPVINSELYTKSKELPAHPWFNKSEVPVILAVGRLTKAKDYPVLIRAFSIVRNECNARLLILGEGEERPKLENLVQKLGLKDQVDIPGFAVNPYAYMAHAAVYVLSSAWEGLPNALIEAMAVGTPIVSTDCKSGPKEILNGGMYGKLVPVGDVEALAENIVKLIEERDYDLPKEEWMKRFSFDICIDKYIKYLQMTE